MISVMLVVMLLSVGIQHTVSDRPVNEEEPQCNSRQCTSSFGLDCGFPDMSSQLSLCRSPQDACNVEIKPPDPPDVGQVVHACFSFEKTLICTDTDLFDSQLSSVSAHV